MKVAHIVPLRRVQNAAPWFDYAVPGDLEVELGQLVTIPFRHQQINGIVWGLADSSAIKELQPISTIVRVEPIITLGQRKVCEEISQRYFVPLAQVLLSAVPTFSSRQTKNPSKKVNQSFTHPRSAADFSTPAKQTLWYRDRRAARSWIADWLRSGIRPKLLLVPTVVDGQDLQTWLEPQGCTLPFVSSQLTAVQYRQIYDGIATGTITAIISTQRGLTLPWPDQPDILIDQEDHPAYKQLSQHPRLDPRALAELLSDSVIAITPAPTVAWFANHRPTPPSSIGQRQLVSLDRPGHRPWISDEVAAIVDHLGQTEHLLWIVPQRGYAQVIRCRDCGQTVECSECHERVQLRERPDKKVLCQHCGHVFQLPATCQNCHGVSWRPVGLASEYFAELLKQFWPNQRVSTSWPPLEAAQHWIGTTGAYQWLQNHSVKAVIIVSGDSLLNWPDFSAAERAWQFLARLQASQPATPLIAQSFHPESNFWQRWRHGDDQRWYEEELKERQALRLPPTVDQWLVHWRGTHAADERERLERELKNRQLPGVTWRWLHSRPNELRLLVTAPIGQLAHLGHPLTLWPWPWQIDPQVTTWLT